MSLADEGLGSELHLVAGAVAPYGSGFDGPVDISDGVLIPWRPMEFVTFNSDQGSLLAVPQGYHLCVDVSATEHIHINGTACSSGGIGSSGGAGAGSHEGGDGGQGGPGSTAGYAGSNGCLDDNPGGQYRTGTFQVPVTETPRIANGGDGGTGQFLGGGGTTDDGSFGFLPFANVLSRTLNAFPFAAGGGGGARWAR